MKKLIIGLTIVIMLVSASCSTVPGAGFSAKFEVDKILGPVPAEEFDSYSEALAAAKKIYPAADAIVCIRTMGGNNILPWTVEMGYFAVTIKVASGGGGGLFK